MRIQSKELEEYIEITLGAISRGVKKAGGFKLKRPVKLSIAVTNVKSGSSGLKVYVAEALGKLKREELSRIDLIIDPETEEVNPVRSSLSVLGTTRNKTDQHLSSRQIAGHHTSNGVKKAVEK